MKRLLIALLLAVIAAPPRGFAQGLELRVGPKPLERALEKQLFSAPDGRFYLRGNRQSLCSLYAQHPQLKFEGDRIVLAMQLDGKIGREFGGECLGVPWTGTGELSMLPQAQGATIGFSDVRVEHLTGDTSLDRLVSPLIEALAPRAIHVDAAALIGKMLRTASAHSGTEISLQQLSISGMQVVGNNLQLFAQGVVSVE